jgi:hypothetical protein
MSTENATQVVNAASPHLETYKVYCMYWQFGSAFLDCLDCMQYSAKHTCPSTPQLIIAPGARLGKYEPVSIPTAGQLKHVDAFPS